MEGTPIGDVWTDITSVAFRKKERVGYPTQKPLALLERIIQASSNAGDVVLDPFCGCGTTVVAAEKLGRSWIGIDKSHVAISLTVNRLADMFGFVPGKHYEVVGDVPLVTTPQDTDAPMEEVGEAAISGQLTLPF
jgi:site-specific DNA-methyltransferase (adenine-specific)